MSELWNSSFESKYSGTSVVSLVDDIIKELKEYVRKCLAVIVTDTSDNAVGSGADVDNMKVKDNSIDSDAYVDGSIDTAHIAALQVTLEKLAADSVDENKIVSTTLGAGLAGGSGTTLSVDGVVEAGSTEMKMKVVQIGDWNMDTTATLSVAHGLTLANIRSLTVCIRNDAANKQYMDVQPYGVAGSDCDVWVESIDATNVNLRRRGAVSTFDSADFDSTTYNRGWLVIWYAA